MAEMFYAKFDGVTAPHIDYNWAENGKINSIAI